MSSNILGSLHKVDCESLNGVVQQYDQALDENFTKRNQFEKFRDDYTKLRSRLRTLPDKLEYDAMVPICSKAICPGKLIHTNEILVLLGENTFVECTTKKAAEIITHRLKNIDETLNRLDKERELYNSWKLEAERQMVETLGDGTIEIVEDYDEEAEKEWRKGHRDSVRRYHQDLGKKRAAVLSTTAVNNVGKSSEEEKLWTRLDALELEEEFMEAQAIYEQRIEEGVGGSNNNNNKCTVKIRERTRSTKLGLPEFQPDNKEVEEVNSGGGSSGKKVTFSPDNIIHNLTDINVREGKKKGKMVEITPNSGNEPSEQIKEEVELYKPSDSGENGLFDPIFIRFRHDPLPSSEDSDLVSSDSEDSDEDDDDNDVDYQIVLSPGDIYEQFGPPSLEAKSIAVPGADKTPLKSILKPRGQQGTNGRGGGGAGPDSKISQKDRVNLGMKKALCETPSVRMGAFISDVKERVTTAPPVPDTRVNDIYAMFPGLGPPPSCHQQDPVDESNLIQDHGPSSKEGEEGDSSSDATTIINLSAANNNCKPANNTTSSNRPLSLFKRMKSGERALSSDTTNQ